MSSRERYVIKGVKKLFSLTKTKIRLAREANTTETKPKPLPIVKKLSGVELSTVKEAEEHRIKLKEDIDYDNPKSIAYTTFQLLDIIEGVKHKFEPKEYFCLLSDDELKKILETETINILLLHEPVEGTNLFVGEDPPEGVTHLGRVTTNLARFISILLTKKTKKVRVYYGRKTLINNAVYYALKTTMEQTI